MQNSRASSSGEEKRSSFRNFRPLPVVLSLAMASMTIKQNSPPPRRSSKRPMFSFGEDDDDLDDDPSSLAANMKLKSLDDTIDRSAFAAPDFDPDQFLSSRRHLGLERLKVELNAHLRFLKRELVELINRDYQDFINLSTNLKGVDNAMEDLQRPLAHMATQVEVLNEGGEREEDQ